jgi:hypothetical protein
MAKNTRMNETKIYFEYARAIRFHMRNKTLSWKALECLALMVEHIFYFAKENDEDQIALSQFIKEGRMSKWSVIEGIDELLECNLIERDKGKRREINRYRILKGSLEELDLMLEERESLRSEGGQEKEKPISQLKQDLEYPQGVSKAQVSPTALAKSLWSEDHTTENDKNPSEIKRSVEQNGLKDPTAENDVVLGQKRDLEIQTPPFGVHETPFAVGLENDKTLCVDEQFQQDGPSFKKGDNDHSRTLSSTGIHSPLSASQKLPEASADLNQEVRSPALQPDESALFGEISLALTSAASVGELKKVWRGHRESIDRLPGPTQSALVLLAAQFKTELSDRQANESTVPPGASQEGGVDEWEKLTVEAVSKEDLLSLVHKAAATFSREPEKLERVFQVIRKRKEQLPKGETR